MKPERRSHRNHTYDLHKCTDGYMAVIEFPEGFKVIVGPFEKQKTLDDARKEIDRYYDEIKPALTAEHQSICQSG